jgi:hypothetical protein
MLSRVCLLLNHDVELWGKMVGGNTNASFQPYPQQQSLLSACSTGCSDACNEWVGPASMYCPEAESQRGRVGS